MKHYEKTDMPITTGREYKNGISTYKVLCHCTTDCAKVRNVASGWECFVHNPAIYQTSDGLQLIWDYSTGGRFAESACNIIRRN